MCTGRVCLLENAGPNEPAPAFASLPESGRDTPNLRVHLPSKPSCWTLLDVTPVWCFCWNVDPSVGRDGRAEAVVRELLILLSKIPSHGPFLLSRTWQLVKDVDVCHLFN
ncbi:hypothetical protein VIGAN_01248400 [Vigna angularis var. angularis]|uniref:Uncharacterized protein n=1 Tax=Vigna angularis var. angularis TaxID=157739 RepID=A0A0S3R2I7_PHAAN|nr:hypothetical protein VIGAN_01248400 [Vigna angularis var. angularis]